MGSLWKKLKLRKVRTRKQNNDEQIDAVIGLDKRWNLLYVLYIERENEIIRIISARKATRKEREYDES